MTTPCTPFLLSSRELTASGGFLPLLEDFQHYSEHIFIDHPKQPTHLFSHPRYVPLLLQPKKFAKLGKQGRISGLSRILGQGILTNSDDASWRKHRHIIQPLLSTKQLQTQLPTFIKQVDMWGEALDTEQSQPTDLYQAMLDLSQRIMYQCIFGTDVPENALAISLALATGKRQKAQRARIDYLERVQEHVQRNNVQRNSAGICPHLQQAGLQKEALYDELLTLMAAGHETSAAALTWTLLLLLHHPEAMARYQDAIANVAVEDLASLRYPKAVFAEVLRLYPSIPVAPRVCLENTNVADAHIQQGERVMVNILGIQRHNALWRDARSFQPERWGTLAPERFHYLPFGAGQRFCVGRALAKLMGEMLLPYMLQRCVPQKSVPQRSVSQKSSDDFPVARLAISLTPKGAIPVTWQRHA